jgi:hypothetical protein
MMLYLPKDNACSDAQNDSTEPGDDAYAVHHDFLLSSVIPPSFVCEGWH